MLRKFTRRLLQNICLEVKDKHIICDVSPIWSCVVHIFGLPNECIDRSPAQRLGIVDTSLSSLLQIVIVFRVYHAMKGRLEEGNYSNDMSVEISWAADLMKHLFMEIPKMLRRENG